MQTRVPAELPTEWGGLNSQKAEQDLAVVCTVLSEAFERASLYAVACSLQPKSCSASCGARRAAWGLLGTGLPPPGCLCCYGVV